MLSTFLTLASLIAYIVAGVFFIWFCHLMGKVSAQVQMLLELNMPKNSQAGKENSHV